MDGNKQTLSIPFEILPAPLQIKAKQQIIKEGETISNTLEQMETEGLKGADTVTAVQLGVDTQEVTTTGKITVIPSAVEIKDANGRLVNDNYDITYEPGRLVILPAEEDASEIIGAGSIAADYYVGDGAPQTTLTNLTAEFAKNLLTEEELQQVENGEHVLVYLDITNIDDTVSKAVRSLAEKAAQGQNADMQVGMYLDLSLYKKIGYDSPVKLSSTKGNLLQVKMELPQKLIPAEGAERSFYMIRVHNQKAELIPVLYDAENQSLTFETDRFSTYAIVYADAKNETPEPVNPNPVIPNTSSSRRDKDRSSRTGWWTGKGNGWILKPETTEWYYIENGALKKAGITIQRMDTGII